MAAALQNAAAQPRSSEWACTAGHARTPELAAGRCAERLAALGRRRCRIPQLGFDLSVLPHTDAPAWLERFEVNLAGRLPGLAFDRPPLLFSIDLRHSQSEALFGLRRSGRLGYPAIALRYTAVAPERLAWLARQSHEDLRVHPVPARSVRPLSALHGLEAGECVLPASLLEVRADTAWLMLEVDAVRLAEPRGARRLMASLLQAGDELIDRVQWPSVDVQVDALTNRRVCIHVARLGEYVRSQGLHPDHFRTLTHLRRFLTFLRGCLVHESRAMARRFGPFAGLHANELIAELAPRYGALRARRLVHNRCLRHRHLFALSPFDLLPDEPHPVHDSRWLNLIPALACADVISMRRSARRARLRLRDWARLLQLTAALPEQTVDISTV